MRGGVWVSFGSVQHYKSSRVHVDISSCYEQLSRLMQIGHFLSDDVESSYLSEKTNNQWFVLF